MNQFQFHATTNKSFQTKKDLVNMLVVVNICWWLLTSTGSCEHLLVVVNIYWWLLTSAGGC